MLGGALLVMLEVLSLQSIKEAGAQGLVADVTDRLGVKTIDIDYPGRASGESRLRLIPLEEIKNCMPPCGLCEDDAVLIFGHDGEVLLGGTVTAEGRFRHTDGRVSPLGVAAYCSHWRSAAGVKVLREPWWKYRYTKRECYVPMRDGASLYTAVYEPYGQKNRPIIMQRSPYDMCPFGTGGPADIKDNLRMYADNAYIIVYQNVRGTYMSEGEFENVRPLGGGAAFDEATDTYDTIDWLLANTSNNGRVGIYGVSYPGFYATVAAACGHPSLKAVSPQAPVTDWWKGDDTHHNGALMLCDMYGFGGFFFLPKNNPTPDTAKGSATQIPEGTSVYDFFRGKSMRQVFRMLGDSLEFFEHIKAHPDYDSFWQERNPLRHLSGVEPAMMVVGGLYDAEDAWGAVHTYAAIKDRPESYFVYGPWTHGGWRKVDWYLEQIEYPFFAYYLEGKGHKPKWKEVYLPTGLSEPGSEEFHMLANPSRGKVKTFALKAGKYTSDPESPVPYMDSESSWRDKSYMWSDQRFASARPDVLSRIVKGPLKDTLWAVGPVKAHLRFKTDATDADFVVKLIDVAPDGTQSLVRWDIMPARWRSGTDRACALVPGEVSEVDMEMVDICHCFLPGHSIMVQVQSSMFPLAAMNPQTFLKNQYTAARKDYRACEINILRGSTLSIFSR